MLIGRQWCGLPLLLFLWCCMLPMDGNITRRRLFMLRGEGIRMWDCRPLSDWVFVLLLLYATVLTEILDIILNYQFLDVFLESASYW